MASLRARLRLWLLLGAALGALALAACFEEEDRGPGVHVGATWQAARDVIGHRVHVLEHKVACSACHDISGKEIDRPTAKSCVGECHEKEAQIEHALAQAREHLGADAPSDCLQCHQFVLAPEQEVEVRAWDCMRCHAEAQGETPAVVIHKRSTCQSCHQPHAGPGQQAKPSECSECHDDISTTHAATGKTAGEVCATCHQNQHEQALHARASCQPCHAVEQPIVPASALFEGHTECTGCHRPHAYEKAKAVPCRECHQDTPVIGGGRVAAHANCESCHRPHDVNGAITRACVSCHTQKSTNHPKPKVGEVCSTCHDPHPPLGQTSPARACTNCHQAAATETAFHGGKGCKDCHTPHQFVVAAQNGTPAQRDFCKQCHAGAVGATAKIAQHGACGSCHSGLPHRPGTTNNCATAGCHAQLASRMIIKHNPCSNCHEPHGGGVVKGCDGCHAEQQKRAPSGHRACASCHDAHAGNVTKTCTTCHSDKLSAPHAAVQGGCATCHSAHDKKGVTFAASCQSCHATSKLGGLHQVPKHQGCATCHATHRRAYTDERAACTSPCHLDMQNHKPESPRCASCHLFK